MSKYQNYIDNPKLLNDLPNEILLEMEKSINPLSYVHKNDANKQKKLAISIMNLRDEYLMKFHMTSLVAFLFRMFREWEPTAEERRWSFKKNKVDPSPLSTEELKTFSNNLNVLIGGLEKQEKEFLVTKDQESQALTAALQYAATLEIARFGESCKIKIGKTEGEA